MKNAYFFAAFPIIIICFWHRVIESFSKNIFSKKILVKKVNYKIILGNNFNSNFNLKEFCLFFYSWLYYKVFFRKYVYERIIGLYNLWIFFFNYSLN